MFLTYHIAGFIGEKKIWRIRGKCYSALVNCKFVSSFPILFRFFIHNRSYHVRLKVGVATHG